MIKLLSILPFITNSFEEVISLQHIYIGKTSYIETIIDNSLKVSVLSRPRGFGKSLTISTLESLFSGRKELFRGLSIESRLIDPRYAPRPVIRLDMDGVEAGFGPKGVGRSLAGLTYGPGASKGLDVGRNSLPNIMLGKLIEGLRRWSGQKVAVLVDGYDSPYLSFLNQGQAKLSEIREILYDYYKMLKSCDDSISFVFMTGIGDFAGSGLSRGLDHAWDISAEPDFAAICGFTEEEVRRVFGGRVDGAAGEPGPPWDKLFSDPPDRLEGRRFDGKTRVFSPLSIRRFFADAGVERSGLSA